MYPFPCSHKCIIFEKVKEAKKASENAEKEQNQVLDEYENELNNYDKWLKPPSDERAMSERQTRLAYGADTRR